MLLSNILFHFFCGSEGINIWSDTDTACMATALDLCLKEEKKLTPGPKNGKNEENIVNESIMRIKV
jgi:hypothetical protein